MKCCRLGLCVVESEINTSSMANSLEHEKVFLVLGPKCFYGIGTHTKGSLLECEDSE
jgi:hypothetical protein